MSLGGRYRHLKFGKNSSVEESAEFCIARAAVGIINDSLWSCSRFQMHLYVAFGLKVLSVLKERILT